ncbi:hypothetical protein M514_05087, partial [Trichuris suis]
METPFRHAVASFLCFSSSCVIYFYLLFSDKFLCCSILFSCCAVVCIIHFVINDDSLRQVVACSMLLGCVYAMGLYLCTKGFWRQPSCVGLYLCVLSFFHFSEFFSIALFSSKSLSTDSFLLNHSVEYWIAAISSWFEYVVELYQFPSAKRQPLVTYIGLALVLIGELLRKAAIVNAGDCFTHLVSFRRRPEHQLITNGIYSICRHPSYTGWLLWSVGTQVLLCNPICTVLYAVISWKFLAERIRTEELLLVLFFGTKYTKYRAVVPSGIPFVR